MAEGSMNYVLGKLRTAQKEMRAENWTNYALEKFRETQREMGGEEWTNYALEKLRETERDMGGEEWINYVVEKIKVWLVVIEKFGESLIAKLDEVFPPETRAEQLKHWVQVAAPYIIVAAVFLILYYCGGILLRFCKTCFCSAANAAKWVFMTFLSFCSTCFWFCRGAGTATASAGRMMAAPGRPGVHILRAGFEADPKLYFRGLRGG